MLRGGEPVSPNPRAQTIAPPDIEVSGFLGEQIDAGLRGRECARALNMMNERNDPTATPGRRVVTNDANNSYEAAYVHDKSSHTAGVSVSLAYTSIHS